MSISVEFHNILPIRKFSTAFQPLKICKFWSHNSIAMVKHGKVKWQLPNFIIVFMNTNSIYELASSITCFFWDTLGSHANHCFFIALTNVQFSKSKLRKNKKDSKRKLLCSRDIFVGLP